MVGKVIDSQREVVLSSEELRRLQLVQLELLIEVDRVCRKNNINYFLIMGTLLGAVRHKGFIPWDDDLDIGFLREDYEKFCSIFAQETDSGKFFLQTWKTDPHYFWGFGKIRRLGTDYVRSGQEHMKYVTGICIDIFAFDYQPNTYYKMHMQALTCLICRKGAYSRVGKYHANKWRTRLLFRLMSLIPGRFYASVQESCAKKYNGKKSAGNRIRQFADISPGIREPMKGNIDKVFSNFIEIEFEGRMFMTIEKWDEYLTSCYKDYMKIPSPENQIINLKLTKIDFGDST